MNIARFKLLKRCKCCGEIFTAQQWNALPLIELNEFEPGAFLELRRCPCAAALGLEILGTAAAQIVRASPGE